MTESVFKFTPIVIIGAARSGTNALRDTLVKLPDFETWPCDEINPIWRHGNLHYPNDELPISAALPHVRKFIRKKFKDIWRQKKCPSFIVEKTCSNSLRVPFVASVLPEARFVYIVRNGINVVSSAKKRWRGELEVPAVTYFLKKALYAPVNDLPHYAISAIKQRMAILIGRQKKMKVWGPRFIGIERYANAALEELCARQWVACINKADEGFSHVPADRIVRVSYEQLISDPISSITKITDRLELNLPQSFVELASQNIRVRNSLSTSHKLSDVEKIFPYMKTALRRHGYL